MKQNKLKNGETIVIRKAKKTDAMAMLNYIDKISRESQFLTFGPDEFNMTLEEEIKYLENISKQNNGLFIIAEIQGEIIGNLNFSGGTRPRIAHVGELGVSVLKEYWNHGVATTLLEYLIEWCKESDIIKKINLRVRSDNDIAIHIYKKLGFDEEGLIKREFFIDDKFYDCIFMGLTID